MRIVVLLMLFWAPIAPLAAKCGDRFLVFSGSVTDQQGNPVKSALVGVAWSERSTPGGPAMSLTDSAGRYSIPVNFNTYSGPSALRGDSCNGVLKRVSVSAYTDSQRSWPLILDIDSKSLVDVPLLKIVYPIKREPTWPHEVGG